MDYTPLEAALYQDSKTAFSLLIDQYADQGIYSLALYHSGSFGYILPTLATEQGLKQVVASYQQSDYYRDYSEEELQTILRWSPCDSPFHDEDELPMDASEPVLQQLSEEVDDLCMTDPDWNAKIQRYWQDYMQVCLKVLHQLDQDGVFAALPRESFTLNLLCGDQSEDERIKWAFQLNPEAVAEAYARDVKAAWDIEERHFEKLENSVDL